MPADEPSADSAADIGAKLSKWNALVRRARIGRQLKAAALTVSSYANPDGTSIRCGVARLAVDCEIGYSTARRYLAWLRDVGLIELVRAGSYKAGRSDEYRLIVGPDVDDSLHIPDADEYRKLVDEVNGSNRSGEKARRMRDLRSSMESADATESPDHSALNTVSAETLHLRSFPGPSALTQDEPPPSSNHLPIEDRPSTGGAPPPDPRRRPPPPASANESRQSLTGPLTQAQDQQGESLPHANARGPSAGGHVAPVYDFFTREVS